MTVAVLLYSGPSVALAFMSIFVTINLQFKTNLNLLKAKIMTSKQVEKQIVKFWFRIYTFIMYGSI
jgi:hypothetical protein